MGRVSGVGGVGGTAATGAGRHTAMLVVPAAADPPRQ